VARPDQNIEPVWLARNERSSGAAGAGGGSS
jgi:hypothetical protein